MNVTRAHHIALFTGNFDRLKQFYVETIGLPQIGSFPGGKTIFLQLGDTAVELIERADWQSSEQGGWQHLALEILKFSGLSGIEKKESASTGG